MKKKIAMLTGGLAVVLVLGLGIYKSDASQADPTLNYDEVKGLILSQYPGTISEIELEKDNNRAVYEIEIVNEGMEYDLKVDANSGEILKLKEKQVAVHSDDQKHEVIELEKEPNDKEDKQEQAQKTEETKIEKKDAPIENKKQENKNTVIDASKAIEIAQKEFPGTVTDVELDEDDGRYIYEIEIKAGGQEAEFEIDAMTGEIIVIDIDD